MGSAPRTVIPPQPDNILTEPSRQEDFGPVDLSLRAPVITLLGWAGIWLLVGLTLSLISALKMHAPHFLSGCEYVTLGRVQPAATNVLLYGWGFNAALGLAFWLLGRLSGSVIRPFGLGLVAILFWNLAVGGGLVGIIAGDSTAIPLLEMPAYILPVLLISFCIIAAWLVTTLRDRAFKDIFISQWYVIGGIFWFAWLASVALLMLVFFPVRGTVQSIIEAWYSHGLLWLWFGAIALAAIYYFLPKLTGRPIRHFYLVSLGFWSYGVFNGWLGVQQLVGSPVPVWVQSVGIAASLMSLVPIVVISVNLHTTLFRSLGAALGSPVLRFIAFASVAFTVSALQLVFTSFGRGVELTHLTYASQAQSYLTFYGFFTMAAFGGIYYLLPRLAQKPWSSAGLINVHFVASALGVLVVFVSLLLAGLKQGAGLGETNVAFITVVESTLPYLAARTGGVALFLIGQIAFVVNLVLTLAPNLAASRTAIVLPEPPELEAAR